ncbi:5-formyltetrahydrofolate cyclo-ligase [Euzebya tangerina]|uniref:5-formyltetrahydrofolate cyclo-ligase n=1 Tax=Euzebya tangerina TaxID=591198 RepID=UPI000E31ACAC|nr:5-formyltetrahydrofolate cyclo-ligase [Euzebya tangerina]
MAHLPAGPPSDDRPVREQKAALRTWAHGVRRGLAEEELRRISAGIRDRLVDLIAGTSAAPLTIGVYAALAREVALDELANRLLHTGHRVAFPRVGAGRQMTFRLVDALGDLEPRQTTPRLPAIREPRAHAAPVVPDVIVMPGLAFDRGGGRLGYGGGYYDGYLAAHPEAQTLGVCPDVLVVQQVPRDDHDQLVGAVITEADVYRCSRHANV